jgi:hypothetical protein
MATSVGFKTLAALPLVRLGVLEARVTPLNDVRPAGISKNPKTDEIY